jgi:soluble lytic murein transglycosylase-like protein
MSNAVTRVDEIRGMLDALRVGGDRSPSTGGTAFADALTAAQGPTATAATATPLSVAPVGASMGAATPFAAEIEAAAQRHGVDPALLKALIRQESNFNPNAVSPAGASGLTQLMPATAQGLGVTDPTNPQQAIEGGAKYLRAQLDRFGNDPRLALAAYNAGPGAVARFGGVPPYAETQNYVQKVMGYADQYRTAAPAPAPAPLVATSPAAYGSIT